ncbi:hypothetical protein Moror_11549, partial [Moniliophthora roreri MCA 2997]
KEYRVMDGRVGAFVDGGSYFVTSPNCNNIYMPCLGKHEVVMRCDYLYGEDDPLNYPQPFISDCCHWATLRC